MAQGGPEGRRSCGVRCKDLVIQNLLVFLTLAGVIIGFVVGLLVEPTNPSKSTLMWLGMVGELYIRMIKMMIVPLVVCSVISGTASIEPKSNGKISIVALSYIMITNLIPTAMSGVVTVLMEPGVGLDTGDVSSFDRDVMETEDIFADLLRNIVPDNIVSSCFRQAQTKYNYVMTTKIINNGTHNVTTEVREATGKYLGSADSTNVLGLILVSVVFGVASKAMGAQGEPFLHFFQAASEIIIRILRVFIWTTPLGVFSLTARTIAATSDVEETFRKLGMYSLTVVITLLIWGLLLMPLLYFLCTKKNPIRFLGSIVPSIMIVFVTASTMIALPDSFISLEKKNGVDKRVSRFVAPLSATIGRGGSGTYIVASCIFIMQTVNATVNAADVVLVIVLTWISTLAIPSVAGASLVTVLILLTALNIPGEAAVMLFALEFFLDRSRSVVNLITQLTGVVFTFKMCEASLKADGQSAVDPADRTDDDDDDKKTEKTFISNSDLSTISYSEKL